MKRRIFYILVIIFVFTACRTDEVIFTSEYEVLPIVPRAETEFASNEPIGMYLLNEGNMGSNKASIDYVDFCNGCYIRNIYSERNPNVVKELGDVGNDIHVYGSKLYAVINCSHKVEVMDARTCERLGQIDIPNCRYIRFSGRKGYVSSYVSPVEMGKNSPQGAVFQFDTATLEITNQVTVGFQPEELEVFDKKLYVANSGGYRKPDYDNTISVIDLQTMKQTQKIPVWENLHNIRRDSEGKLWASAQGDYNYVKSNLVVLREQNGAMTATDTLDEPCSRMCIVGDSLYYISVQWSESEQTNRTNYGIVNTRTLQRVTDNFVTDGTHTDIKIPYALAVNPYNGDIYVSDAKNYVSSGVLHCYSKLGERKWSVRTGDIPAHITFVYR